MASMSIVLAGAIGPGASFLTHDGTRPTESGSTPPVPLAEGRNPLLWPFSKDSVWNLPIGAEAVYVHADIKPASASQVMQPDVDVLVLTPDAPMTSVYYNDDAWSTIPGRCDAEGGVVFTAPIPEDFVVLGNGMGSPHGNTPNYATAILAQDGVTLYQGQPFARCTAGGTATMWWYQTNERLDGLGHSGGHGGSMLSSIGGTIRLGELVPGGTIRHALKLNLNGDNYYSGLDGFRWPATARDSCAPGCYTGSVPEMRMGSLVALKPDFDVEALETDPAKILAHAFMDYGAYAADNAGWSVYGIDTEYSPSGDVMVEFQDVWGFSMEAPQTSPWARDMHGIFGSLHVVDNWDETAWQTVAGSDGLLGVGGGLPRVAWAPDLGEALDLSAPVTTAALDGSVGSAEWYRSPVTVTLTATDEGSGVASIQVRVDGGTWTAYEAPVTVSAEGPHTVEYYATDVAGNAGPVESVEFVIDSVVPTTAYTLSGTLGGDDWYRSAVTVGITASDSGSGVAGIQVRVDGGAWSPYSTPITVAGEGPHTVEFFATDVAGNVGAATAAFWIDTVAPLTTYALSGTRSSSGWYVSTVTVTLSATATDGSPAFVSYRLDGGPWASYSAPFAVGEGRHVLQYQAMDGTGHVSPMDSIDIPVDFTPPTVTRSGSGPIHPNGALSWIGSDAVAGIVRYEVSVDGLPFRSVELETSLRGPWSVGGHVVVVKAFDAAGNEATETISFSASPDAPLDGAPTDLLNLRGTTLWGLIAAAIVLAGVIWYLPRRNELRLLRALKRHNVRPDPDSVEDDESDER